jgi:hypothetical protein
LEKYKQTFLSLERYWEQIWETVKTHDNSELIIIDSTYCKCHQHASGARGGSQEIGLTKRGHNTKIHVAVNDNGLPVKALITSGTVADCSKAIELIDGLE